MEEIVAYGYGLISCKAESLSWSSSHALWNWNWNGNGNWNGENRGLEMAQPDLLLDMT